MEGMAARWNVRMDASRRSERREEDSRETGVVSRVAMARSVGCGATVEVRFAVRWMRGDEGQLLTRKCGMRSGWGSFCESDDLDVVQ